MVNFSIFRCSHWSCNWAKSSQQNCSMSYILFYILYIQHRINILSLCLNKWQNFHINVTKYSVFIHIPVRKESANLKKSWKEIENRNESKTGNTLEEGEVPKRMHKRWRKSNASTGTINIFHHYSYSWNVFVNIHFLLSQ